MDMGPTTGYLQGRIEHFGKDSDVLSLGRTRPFHDADMLLRGVDGVSVVAQSAQLAIYTILAVPLILAVDMRALSSASHALFPNSDVIASHEARTGVRLEVPPLVPRGAPRGGERRRL